MFQTTLLQGKQVRLEPLETRHHPDISTGFEPELFTYMNSGPLRYFEAVRASQPTADETRKPFTLFAEPEHEFAGSTSLYAVDGPSWTFEIGGTWVKEAHRGTGLNTEAKYLLLEVAFEVWWEIRVQIRTHDRNERSKRALEKLGVTKEGVIRHESVSRDGTLRDSAQRNCRRVAFAKREAAWQALPLKSKKHAVNAVKQPRGALATTRLDREEL